MAEEDIYKNRKKYERFMGSLDQFLIPAPGLKGRGRRLYHCRNPQNIQYFKKLHRHFETRDLSYISRCRLFDTLRFITFVTEKDIAICGRNDIDEIVARSHKVNHSSNGKETFIKNLKRIWSTLFPEIDDRGRIEDDLKPYPVRHLSSRIDKSKQRLRNDRLTLQEFERLVSYFGRDVEMQAYITLAVESLGRPQEICYTRMRDVELHESYARIWISSHGKEGTKFLHCIDSYPYLMKWYSKHPHQGDDDAYLFLARNERDRQLTPANINKKLRNACKRLGIDRQITAYSLKRNGVTFRRLRGDSDVEIQHVAGWTSTKQLQTYDLSSAEDVFKKQLARRGLAAKEDQAMGHVTKNCVCGTRVGFSEKICDRCKRVVDSKQVTKDMKADLEIREVFSLALNEPDRSFAEIIEEYRRKQRVEC